MSSAATAPDRAVRPPRDLEAELQSLHQPHGWRRLLAPLTHRVSGKIIAPYLIIVILLAIFATYIVMNLVTTSLEEKFRGQLADAGRAANEAMVVIETDHLRVFRQMAFTEGVAQHLRAGRVEELRALVAPVAVNAGLSYVDLLDERGSVVLVLRPRDRLDDAAGLVDRNIQEWPPVRNVLEQREDARGDKHSSIVRTPWGLMLYTAGPVKLDGEQVGEQVGVLAVGTPLDKVVARLSQETRVGITLYGPEGAAVASSLPGAAATLSIDPTQFRTLTGTRDEVQQRTVSLSASRYLELLGLLDVRREPALVMGVSQSISLIADKGAETRDRMLLIFSLVIVAVLLAGYLLARMLLRPIKLLVEACKALAAGDFTRDVPITSPDETGLLAVAFNQSLQGLRERDRAREAFGLYMSPELYQAIQSGELKLGGEERVITTLISDIRGFTSLSERMDPEVLVSLLNSYFETQVDAIRRHGGMVDKFMGDAILARFGAPIWHPDHARRAVLAMLDMRSALAEFNQQLQQHGYAPLRVGMGANSGSVVVGNIGSTSRMEYTIIGDSVNTTQRIEDLTKELQWDLLISESTYEQARDLIEVRPPHRLTLRGRRQETLVFPVVGRKLPSAPKPATRPVEQAPVRPLGAPRSTGAYATFTTETRP